jgi:hypothetical protein
MQSALAQISALMRHSPPPAGTCRFFESIADKTITTVHGRQDIKDLRESHRHYPNSRSVEESLHARIQPEARETFLSLQMTWISLAMELQQAGAPVKAAE